MNNLREVYPYHMVSFNGKVKGNGVKGSLNKKVKLFEVSSLSCLTVALPFNRISIHKTLYQNVTTI